MAYFGLSKPWIAKLNVETGKYSNGFKCGKAISTTVTPNYSEASLSADNQEQENVSEFKNAAVALGVDSMPAVAEPILFGHTTNINGEKVSKTGDSANYVGYGFIVAAMNQGIKKYQACILTKVLFKEGEESYETKGDSIVFKTPTLSGTAMGNNDTDWRIKSPEFATEDLADNWIQQKLNVVETCETPVASVEGGEYSTTQSVKLTCATAGATIKYTIDGTTPSQTNGNTFSSNISVAKNTGIRAIAYKEGAGDSGIMVEEYFITA